MEMVSLSAPFLEWLKSLLRGAAKENEEAEELQQAIGNLLSDRSASMILEKSEEARESPVIGLTSSVIVCDTLRINLKSRTVTQNGIEISLTPKEYELLAFLAENRGEIFTKEQIYQAVWNNDYLLDDSNVMAFIRKLRKKIEPNPDQPRYIQTIWGVGYRFCDIQPLKEP